jgi:CRISPR-associated protein Csm4
MEETSERVHSDTLLSAWLSAYARLVDRETINALVKLFQSPEPPFCLSSTFIYQTHNGRVIDYLPRPLKHPPGFTPDDQLILGKAFKKSKYLPLEVWKRWYQGEGFSDRDRQELQDDTHAQAGDSLTNLGLFAYANAFERHRVPKVAIDRTTRASNFYHTRFVQYHWQTSATAPDGIESLSGLYFLVYFPKPDTQLENTFFAVLDFLGGEGIGGERSSGAGQFKLDPNAKDQELSSTWQEVVSYAEGQRFCLMSLFWQHPLPPALLNGASYDLQERGGWITSPVSDGRQLRRKAVQMFTEGSVFSVPPSGQLANVKPPQFSDHDIYRSGISLSLPINTRED